MKNITLFAFACIFSVSIFASQIKANETYEAEFVTQIGIITPNFDLPEVEVTH